MTIKQLLTGAAAAAMLGGVASAQVTFTPDNAANFGAAAGPVGDFDATNTFASNLDLADLATNGTAVGGDLNLLVSFAAAGNITSLGATDQIDLTLTVTGAEFTAVVSSGNFESEDDAAAGSCDFTIQAGGSIGTSTVTFRSPANVATCTDADLMIALPLDITANSANFSWDIDLVGPGTDLQSGTYDHNGATDGGDLVERDAAFGATYAAVDTALLVSPDFEVFTGEGNDDDLGSVQIVTAVRLLDLANNIAIADAAADGTLTLTLEDASNIALFGFDIGGAAGALDGTDPTCVPTGTSCAIDLTAAQLTAIEAAAVNVLVETDGAGPVAEQSISANLTYTAAETWFSVAAEAGDLGDILQDDGLSSSPVPGDAFNWVKVGDGGTENNFRMSGNWAGNEAGISGVLVNFGNSNDADIPSSVTLAVSTTPDEGFRISNGVLSFTSRGLGAAVEAVAPTFDGGNSDITSVEVVYDESVFCDGAANGDCGGALVDLSGTANTTISRLLINRSELGLSDLD